MIKRYYYDSFKNKIKKGYFVAAAPSDQQNLSHEEGSYKAWAKRCHKNGKIARSRPYKVKIMGNAVATTPAWPYLHPWKQLFKTRGEAAIYELEFKVKYG